VNRLGGQVIKLSPVSTQYINPMDIVIADDKMQENAEQKM